jgi:membrane protein implicated in regulation of membrane protease activity
MDFFTNNLAESLLIIGLILLVIEVAVLGFSTFVLFFVGLAAMVTGALLYVSILPDSGLGALFSTGILTIVFAIVLWRPLKRMQSSVSPKKAQGDLVGHQFVLKDFVSPAVSPSYHYSGVNWTLISDEAIEAGTRVEVIEAEVGAFHIKAVNSSQ